MFPTWLIEIKKRNEAVELPNFSLQFCLMIFLPFFSSRTMLLLYQWKSRLYWLSTESLLSCSTVFTFCGLENATFLADDSNCNERKTEKGEKKIRKFSVRAFYSRDDQMNGKFFPRLFFDSIFFNWRLNWLKPCYIQNSLEFSWILTLFKTSTNLLSPFA